MASKQQQVNEVVEGLGVGLVAVGRTRVSTSKLALEFAFAHAWRQWPGAGDYPAFGRAVKADNEFWIGVGRSERRTRARVLWQDRGSEYEIAFLPSDYTAEEAAESVSSRPLDEWIALALPFVSHLDGTAQR